MSHAAEALGSLAHVRHRPEQTLLYQLVERHYPVFARLMALQGSPLPGYVAREFEDYLKCGRLEHGFLRVRCGSCHHEKLVAFSCKRRGFCPSCGARRMVDSAALLVDEVLPKVPLRQWVLSVPFQLRFLFASYPELMGKALGIVYRTISTWLIRQAGFTHDAARTGAVTLCEKCKGPVRIIACIEDPGVIEKILNHLKAKEAKASPPSTRLPLPRAPPLLQAWEQGLAD